MYDINQFNNLRQAILDKIEADETSIQEAFFHQPSVFQGSPSAVVSISSNEALYNSSKVDRMTFVFQVMLYIPMNDPDAAEDVEKNMGKAYWEVMHMFSNRGSLDGVSGMTDIIVEPLPSIWAYEERDAGVFRVAEINLRCVVFVSNQNT